MKPLPCEHHKNESAAKTWEDNQLHIRTVYKKQTSAITIYTVRTYDRKKKKKSQIITVSRDHLNRENLAFSFSLKVADNTPLYGICVYVQESVQRSLALLPRSIWRG